MDLFLQRVTISRKPPASASSNPSRKTAPERRAKRLKVDESWDSDDDSASYRSSNEEDHDSQTADPSLSVRKAEAPSHLGIDGEDTPSYETAFEISLPSVKTDREAIEEYEVMRASQVENDSSVDGTSSHNDSHQWVRGRSSIYVDAFNLALDTVLEDEAHLFDKRENAVFAAWRALKYEPQYLYVRLFLRKTAVWHRIDKLGYYGDISDPEAAIQSLQEARNLPSAKVQGSGVEDSELQDWSLGDAFTFADSSKVSLTTVEEAASLLNLDELKSVANDAKVTGKSKADLTKALCRMSAQQAGLMSLGLRKSNTDASTDSEGSARDKTAISGLSSSRDSNRNSHFLNKILAITGPCIRISESVFKLFERVHLVFYRSTEWTEKSLTTIILAKIARRNFPEYIVDRSSNIFPTRRHLLEFERAMRLEFDVDKLLEANATGPPGEDEFHRILNIFEGIAPCWRAMMRAEQRREDGGAYEFNEGCYLRRFSAAHPYTRIAHKAAYAMGRLKNYAHEHALFSELLAQRLFHLARRGAWYQRKALLEEHYMWNAVPAEDADGGTYNVGDNTEQLKRHWRRIAVATCEAALEDRDCHLIYHHDLQKRLVKLEKRLRIPRRLQHDFGHVRLREPEEHYVEGIQLRKEDDRPPQVVVRRPSGTSSATTALPRNPNTKTVWVDEAEGGGSCSVEAMCLSWYRARGWKGYHAEGGIVLTLFAYLLFDVLFLYVPGVFQTAYQAGPLDLHAGGDAFYPARASEINHRLVEIANGGAEAIVRRIDAAHRERRTCAVGLSWDFELEDLAELVRCFHGPALAAVCKVMAQEYRQRGGGVPDLLLWRTGPELESRVESDGGEGLGGAGPTDREVANGGLPKGEVMFVEVKSANDRLSDTQRLWIHVLTGAGVRVALCNAVAKEVRAIT